VNILKLFLIAIVVVIIAFLGIKFIPGFFPREQNPESQVQSVSLLGLDKSIVSAHFTIYFHSADESEAKAVIASGERAFPALSNFFPKTPRTEILLTDSTDEYVNVFNAAPPWGAEAYKDPNTSAGSFCPGCTKSLGTNTEYIYMLRPKKTGFVHELSHRYYWTNYPNIRTDDSLVWLNEGLAVYVQNEIAKGPGGLSSTGLPNIKNSQLPENFSELTKLQQGDNKSVEIFYDLAGLLAYYIADRTNDKGLQGFLTELNGSKNLEKTCRDKLGFGTNQLFANWKEVVIETAAENPSDFLKSFSNRVMP
jgi:hypothetical protein